jgi:hypothetical protein
MRSAVAYSLLALALFGFIWWRVSSGTDNLAGKSYEHEMSFLPIDVVYTWVNGSDPAQKEALHHARRVHLGENTTDSEVLQDSRYVDNEELRFSMRSLEVSLS